VKCLGHEERCKSVQFLKIYFQYGLNVWAVCVDVWTYTKLLTGDHLHKAALPWGCDRERNSGWALAPGPRSVSLIGGGGGSEKPREEFKIPK